MRSWIMSTTLLHFSLRFKLVSGSVPVLPAHRNSTNLTNCPTLKLQKTLEQFTGISYSCLISLFWKERELLSVKTGTWTCVGPLWSNQHGSDNPPEFFKQLFVCGWWWAFLSSSCCLIPWHGRVLPTERDAFTRSILDAFRSLPCPRSHGALAFWRRVKVPASAPRPQHFLSALVFSSTTLLYVSGEQIFFIQGQAL